MSEVDRKVRPKHVLLKLMKHLEFLNKYEVLDTLTVSHMFLVGVGTDVKEQ